MDTFNDYDTPNFDGSTLDDGVGHVFKKEPAINVISKEEFEARVEKVFHLLWKTLSKSFGPYGAPTIIYNYPWSHVTKDGYTIMKNLSMNAADTKVDQAIADMAADICGRLNYTVGDGTTSAVIATDSIYKNYMLKKEALNKKRILPRDVLKIYDKIKENVISELSSKVVEIRSEDKDKLAENIRNIVYISSNGDDIITNYISELYNELGTSAISCILSPDGVTRKKLIRGYQYDLILNDRLYINSDDNTMKLNNADVLVFATKITKDTYNNILKPLNDHCRQRGRHLIVCAPSYDEIALSKVISVDLNNEYKKTHDVNMVLTTYKAISSHTRRLVNDFAVLMGTQIIDRALEQRIIDYVGAGGNILSIISVDNREIDGLKKLAVNQSHQNNTFCTYVEGEDTLPSNVIPFSDYVTLEENYIPLGYTGQCSLGLKTSLFTEFYYDEKMYEVCLNEAKALLDEAVDKYKKLGTFNIEVSQAQERLYSLYLKRGVIEVGADSELSQKMLKDSVDDAIKAASSAYTHGIVKGCNVSLLQVIFEMMKSNNDDTTSILLEILFDGFKDVYKTVLGNAFEDYQVTSEPGTYTNPEMLEAICLYLHEQFDERDKIFDFDTNAFERACDDIRNRHEPFTLFNLIVYMSIESGKVFDVSEFEFSDLVINSSQTDEEILKATIDLIGLLITGNQMVVTQKHNF